jgi:hypothetical protein
VPSQPGSRSVPQVLLSVAMNTAAADKPHFHSPPPPAAQVNIYVSSGSHASEAAVNKQLNDKERCAAAMENKSLVSIVNTCIATKYG